MIKSIKCICSSIILLLVSNVFAQDNPTELLVCSPGDKLKCAKLTYDGSTLIVKSNDDKDATLNVANASFGTVNTTGAANFFTLKTTSKATLNSVDVVTDANFKFTTFGDNAVFQKRVFFGESTSASWAYFDNNGHLWKWIQDGDQQKKGWYRLSVNNVQSHAYIKTCSYAHWCKE